MEIWKKIDGYENYEVSSSGRVRSLTIKSKGKLLKPIKTKKGYLTVRLYNSQGFKHLKIHRLVALAFIPNIHDKPQVNHIDGVKTNNCVKNLEWCSNEENIRHAFSFELNKIEDGEKARNNKLSNEQALKIKQSYVYGQKGLAQILADKYNVSKDTIRSIWYGKNWSILD